MALSIFRNGLKLSKNAFNCAKRRPNFTLSNPACTCPAFFGRNEVHLGWNVGGLREYGKHAAPKKGKKYSSDSESDSDLEEVGKRGNSEFWRRKIRTFHGILDVNKDGVISFDDFKLLAERFVNLGNLSEKSSKEFMDLIKDLWEKRFGEISPYNLVTVEKYLDDMHHVLNDKDLVRRAHTFLPYLFKALDKDKSGTITVEEHKLFFECLGLPEKDAILAFRSIDSNGDGKITKQEFVKHGRDFFLTEDENRISKYFWGPLVL